MRVSACPRPSGGPRPMSDEWPSEWQTSIIAASSCTLLFLSMAFPAISALRYVKGSLLVVLLLAIALEYLTNGRSSLDGRVGLWTAGLVTVSFLFVMEGFIARAPGASSVIGVYIVWPVIYTFWIAGLAQPRLLLGVHRTAVAATLFIGLFGCLYLLTQLNILPDIGIVSGLALGWEPEAFGLHEGYTQMQFPGMNSVPFLVPYMMAAVAVQDPTAPRHPIRRICLWAACIVGVIVVLTSFRRAFVLVIAVTPLLVVFFRHFQPEAERRIDRRSMLGFSAVIVIGVVVIVFGLGAIYEFSVSSMWEHMVIGFDFSSQTIDAGADLRHEQLTALVRGWLEHPVLGAGHGASAYGSIRSQDAPWAYELSYMALLFQTGLVGFMTYSAGVFWIFWRGIKIIGEGGPLGRMMIPMLVGCSSFLIANATNPYLSKFDGLWMLFLPLAVINYKLTLFAGASAHLGLAKATQ